VERRQVIAGGDRPVGRLGRLQRLLAEDDDHGVDRRVHRLDPPQVGRDDLHAGRLPSPERGQFRCAHSAQLGGRLAAHADACSDR
jgi:hypothetical protein